MPAGKEYMPLWRILRLLWPACRLGGLGWAYWEQKRSIFNCECFAHALVVQLNVQMPSPSPRPKTGTRAQTAWRISHWSNNKARVKDRQPVKSVWPRAFIVPFFLTHL